MLDTYPEVKKFIECISADFQNIFSHDLCAIYVTGSLATNSYTEGLSDIDMIVVVNKHIAPNEIRTLRDWAQHLLESDSRAAVLDISIVERANVRFDISTHPDALEFWKGAFDYAQNALGNSPIVWDQIIKNGITVYGPKPTEILTSVPWDAVHSALEDEALTIHERIATHFDEIKFRYYVITTLCRIMYTAKERSYVSKKDALLWYLKSYHQHEKLIEAALRYIENSNSWAIDDKQTEYKKFTEEVLSTLQS